MPIFYTAAIAAHERAMRNSDYIALPRPDAISILNSFGDIFGLETFRVNSNFQWPMSLDPADFDATDQYLALQIVVNHLNAAGDDDERVAALRERLERLFGALDKPFNVRLYSFNYTLNRALLH